MRGLPGANVTAPIVRVASLSESGRQESPALRVSQIPPCEAPASQWLVSLGSTAIDAMRPLTGWRGLTWPSRMGAGPIFVQRAAAAEIARVSSNADPEMETMVFEGLDT